MKHLSLIVAASCFVLAPLEAFAQKAPTKLSRTSNKLSRTSKKVSTQKRIQTLTNRKLARLAERNGKWVHFAAFEQNRSARHLACRKNRKQKIPTCIVVNAEGRVLQKRVAFGRYKGIHAVGFRIGSKTTDLWLPMLLQAPDGAGSGESPTTQSDNFGGAFGHDFSGVNVPGDGNAGDLAGQLGAGAFTNGKGVALGGQTSSDSNLVAHEVTHAVTESSGGSSPTGNTDGDSSDGDSSGGGEDSGGNDSGSTGSGNTGSGNTGSN